jgi:hypothetical protein
MTASLSKEPDGRFCGIFPQSRPYHAIVARSFRSVVGLFSRRGKVEIQFDSRLSNKQCSATWGHTNHKGRRGGHCPPQEQQDRSSRDCKVHGDDFVIVEEARKGMKKDRRSTWRQILASLINFI